ncbi:hypothetical protein HPP92_013878 [Vanilla planifolia]|uniref:RRM domain-containing protein n=1 Tax=Vanilla planifolia TaxID=51239 RepID=A0A835QZC5_VANPL|nr:hypothetical protein HPP92_013878 [Vanilla planifolia]
MAKKRKLEAKPENGASSEDFEEELVDEEPAATTLLSEAPGEGSASPENEQHLTERSLTEEYSVTQVIESVDPVPDSSVAVEAVPGDDVTGEDDDDEEYNDPDFLHKLLEPFTKEQLVELLRNAVLKYPDLRLAIRQIADTDPVHRKVFVHGLAWNTTAETLKTYFGQYGEIEDCNAVVDKITGKSKGYGFILFKHRSGARRALEEPQKKIGNRMAACQLASIGPVPVQAPVMHVSEYTQRKIYVSNVGVELDPQKVLQFFSKFGEIEEGPLGVDKATGKFKGFCLFVYKSIESAKKALEEPHKNFEGHILHCQKAIDGPKPTKLGVPLAHGVVQYAGLQQSASVYGPRVTQVGRSDGAVLIGGLNSSVGGPGHLIAPPAASLAGLGVSNGGHAIKSAIGNQVGGTGGYVKPGLISGYGASAQMIGSYGGAVMGQASSRTQPGLGHMGGVGAYLGH